MTNLTPVGGQIRAFLAVRAPGRITGRGPPVPRPPPDLLPGNPQKPQKGPFWTLRDPPRGTPRGVPWGVPR